MIRSIIVASVVIAMTTGCSTYDYAVAGRPLEATLSVPLAVATLGVSELTYQHSKAGNRDMCARGFRTYCDQVVNP
ncbi:MAG: hypothetical protein H6905_01800 [Hyphomicrobiales bacterium]|nr:hypothetical protein [Hyphomicrobiales bacterium]